MFNLKQYIGVWLGLILSLGLTITYLIFAWYVAALWLILVGDTINTTQLSIFALNPVNLSKQNPILLWQLLALVSLLINWVWAFKRVKASQDNDKILLPLACHVTWILSCVLLHVGGGIASFVFIGSVIL